MAEIYKIGEQPTDPHLLLDMIKANIPRLKSVVVSVMYEGDDGGNYQATYHTHATSADLAYHLVGVTHDLQKIVTGEDDGGS